MRTKLAVWIAGAALAGWAAPAYAHHAFAAEFDSKKPVHLDGKVTLVELINPHCWIHVDVKNADGTVTNWMVEAGSPNSLLRRGLTKDTISAGTPVVVDGFQSKDGSSRMNGRDITLPSGQKLFLGNGNASAPEEEKK